MYEVEFFLVELKVLKNLFFLGNYQENFRKIESNGLQSV